MTHRYPASPFVVECKFSIVVTRHSQMARGFCFHIEHERTVVHALPIQDSVAINARVIYFMLLQKRGFEDRLKQLPPFFFLWWVDLKSVSEYFNLMHDHSYIVVVPWIWIWIDGVVFKGESTYRILSPVDWFLKSNMLSGLVWSMDWRCSTHADHLMVVRGKHQRSSPLHEARVRYS